METRTDKDLSILSPKIPMKCAIFVAVGVFSLFLLSLGIARLVDKDILDNYYDFSALFVIFIFLSSVETIGFWYEGSTNNCVIRDIWWAKALLLAFFVLVTFLNGVNVLFVKNFESHDKIFDFILCSLSILVACGSFQSALCEHIKEKRERKY